MYRPKIYANLLPALFETAKSRDIPATQLANSYVDRALRTEYLPISAVKLLPGTPDIAPLGSPHSHLKDSPTEQALEYSFISRLSTKAHAFRDVSEIADWYQEAINGTARALKLAQGNRYTRCRRTPSDQNVQWRYENLAVVLNQIFGSTLSELGASTSRKLIQG